MESQEGHLKSKLFRGIYFDFNNNSINSSETIVTNIIELGSKITGLDSNKINLKYGFELKNYSEYNETSTVPWL